MRSTSLLLAAILSLAFAAWALADAAPGHGPFPSPIGCDRETACQRTGCNGEFCASDRIFSTCVSLPIHACFSLAECRCLGNHCRFVGGGDFLACLRENGAGPGGRPAADARMDWFRVADGREVGLLAVGDELVQVERLEDGSVAVDGLALLALQDAYGRGQSQQNTAAVTIP
jgi:hypothetical protein